VRKLRRGTQGQADMVTGPSHDVYYGGSRDGQRWPIDTHVAELAGRIVDATGGVYSRHPDFDTATDRAWFSLPSDKPTAASGVHIEPQQGRKHLTLADLRNLVVTAERMGHAPGATVYGTVAWRGQLLRVGIKAAEQEGKA
jgi:hypothetical protein